MANTNKSSVRKVHVSPGIYFTESDITYANKSLGITTLGVAGETVKGPAFQPIAIEDWAQFNTYFGGTNTAKFRGSQYPKYELPYIAQSYLNQSKQLQVVRVLGLSGVNAGPAWIITSAGTKNGANMVIAVIRSRGEHKKAAWKASADPDNGICEDVYEYDGIEYYAKEVKLEPSKSLNLNDGCTPGFNSQAGTFNSNSSDYGRFTFVVTLGDGTTKNYSVSLNEGEPEYIYNVLGGNAEDGDAEIYVEELYDVALHQLVNKGEITGINQDLSKYPIVYVKPKYGDVDDLLTLDESMLTRRDVGKRFLFSSKFSKNESSGAKLKVHVKASKNSGTWASKDGEVGHIYTVVSHLTEAGTRVYYYGEYTDEKEALAKYEAKTDISMTTTNLYEEAVKVNADDMFYAFDGTEVVPITLDLNNYKEQYRYASTPWIVSEMKGSAEHVELTKLFRFHTISDGNTANTEVKISIENIDPVYGTFDVVVRDFYDTDASLAIYERYKNCNLIPGDKNYIALKIGSFDEAYETVSKFITVEVNETDLTKVSVPAGFLGYPIRCYNGFDVQSKSGKKPIKPFLQYNTNVDDDIRIQRQYFGMSDLVGIDEDILRYKGVEAYNDLPEGLSPCFHLDSRILEESEKSDSLQQTVSVDGIDGYEWVTVGKGNTLSFGIEPRIGNETTMLNTIYEDKKYRKFTLCFYGGFDGWDYYRTSRSNTDDFKYTKYRGQIDWTSGIGTMFSVIKNPEAYGFEANEKALNSDWYAYLSAIRQFANPKTIDINVLATPGIDYVNNNTLVGEVIDMVENERADSVYVVTTPDKPFGASDSESDMYTPDDIVLERDNSEIDSNYTCSYYPWVKYFDTDNNQYIYLPITRDIVRNFAYTDNTKYPWFAAAGWNRGEITGVRPRKNLKQAEQDALYDNGLNFVNTFAQEGMKIWGDKNMQQTGQEDLNRISKRRLMIRVRKLISISCIGLLFDPNDATVSQSFESAVKSVMEEIQANRGIVRFKLTLDTSDEARERLELPARLIIQATPNLEYIPINMSLTTSGVVFDNN